MLIQHSDLWCSTERSGPGLISGGSPSGLPGPCPGFWTCWTRALSGSVRPRGGLQPPVSGGCARESTPETRDPGELDSFAFEVGGQLLAVELGSLCEHASL